MFSDQRESIILEQVTKNGSVKLAELMDLLQISEATVRRDLTSLEKKGLLKRTHGGAVSLSISSYEANYHESEKVNIDKKQRIAAACAELINDEETVMLDSGTTTFEIARLIKEKKVTLVTNSVTIIVDFIENGSGKTNIISTGGRVRSNLKAFVGTNAENAIRSYLPDVTFVSANGFSIEHGASTPDDSEAAAKRAMLESSKAAYLVVDSSKANKEFFSLIAPCKNFKAIITDNQIDEKIVQAFEQQGVQVIVV